ncbi:MAG: outer membrane protein transport protein [Pseudoxanthomonas sp.]
MLYYSLGASYVIPAWRLSFGAGGNLIYARTQILRAKTTPGSDALSLEGRSSLDASGIVGSFSVGSMWEAIRERLWVGASYQAPPGMYDGMVLKGKIKTYLPPNGMDRSDKVEFHQTLPDIIRLAVRYKADRYELRAFGDYTRWSVMDQQCVAHVGASCSVDAQGKSTAGAGQIINNQIRRWKDSVGLRLGGSYWFSPDIEGFVGLGYETNAIPGPYLTPDIIDGKKISRCCGRAHSARVADRARVVLYPRADDSRAPSTRASSTTTWRARANCRAATAYTSNGPGCSTRSWSCTSTESRGAPGVPFRPSGRYARARWLALQMKV